MTENISNQMADAKDGDQAIQARNGEDAMKNKEHQTDAEERAEGAALLDDVRDALRRHGVRPPHAAEMLAVWVFHTYAFPLRDVTTYVGIFSPEKRCGKTTLLAFLALV